ncbi:MAG TPA: hypothetical protein VHT27_13775 [Solirubrobacteraceae bacterium]|jgi:hypothetical protein|nr:hypothetical protein [Solirubrobacteraceae bacterium]
MLATLLAFGMHAAIAAAQTLPDGRAWEQVSPAEKDGASIEPLTEAVAGRVGGLSQASTDGSAMTYVANGPVEARPEGNRAIEATQVLSTRTPNGWVSRGIVTPHKLGEGLANVSGNEYRRFSEDLSLAIVQPFALGALQEPGLQPGLEREEATVYRRSRAACDAGAAGCFEPILTPQNVTGTTAGQPTPFGGAAQVLGASPSLQQVVVESTAALAPPADPAVEPEELYEIDATRPAGEQVQLVSLVPEEHEDGCATAAASAECFASAPVLGAEEVEPYRNVRGAISADGSRVFWTGTQTVSSKEGLVAVRHLFARDTHLGRTVRIDKAERGVLEPKTETTLGDIHVQMQLADREGTRIFFTDTVPLTTTSNLKYAKEAGVADLYVCELPSVEAGCRLTDLTASLGREGGDVLAGVIGASSDGTTAYFAANGAPEPGGQRGNCESPQIRPRQSEFGTCNLYVVKYEGGVWQPPRLIAQLSGRDDSAWSYRTGQLAARVSPNGRYLAFSSERELTGFHNVDANPAAHGAHDQEVFRYDSQAREGEDPLVCVSCNSEGRAPKGVFDAAGAGLLVDTDGAVWPGRWLAAVIPPWTSVTKEDAPYQSRYLLDDGVVFFDSADPLSKEALEAAEQREAAAQREGTAVPGGVMAVYENEPFGTAGCTGRDGCAGLLSGAEDPSESEFLDASESGRDVFLLTSAQLAPTDIDHGYDVYDAHSCSQAEPCLAPPPSPPAQCTGEACHPAYGGVPGWAPGGTSTFSGPSEGPKGLPGAGVLPSKHGKASLTAKQKLTRALRACRHKHPHNRRVRAACERSARKAYGARRGSHRR